MHERKKESYLLEGNRKADQRESDESRHKSGIDRHR